MPSDAISITSAPVWNALPSPVCTMTRTAGSASSSFHASANSSRMALFMALRRSGRLLINQPTGPWRSSLQRFIDHCESLSSILDSLVRGGF